jgi:TonB family protein
MTRTALSALIPALAIACGKDSVKAADKASTPPAPRPDELPTLVSGTLPFKYPASLYARKVQGNVTLRLFIDRDGRVLTDSTRVDEPSGYAELDSAAMRGAADLHFVPAKLHGDAIAVSILFPVYFRHPEARPLPGDTILNEVNPGESG